MSTNVCQGGCGSMIPKSHTCGFLQKTVLDVFKSRCSLRIPGAAVEKACVPRFSLVRDNIIFGSLFSMNGYNRFK